MSKIRKILPNQGGFIELLKHGQLSMITACARAGVANIFIKLRRFLGRDGRKQLGQFSKVICKIREQGNIQESAISIR